MLRKSIGAGIWLLATGLTIAIVYCAMGTQSWIVTGIGVLGVIASSGGIYFAREAFDERAWGAGIAAIMMWVVGAIFLVPTEINFWSATVTAKAEHEADIQREANARRLVMDEAAEQIRKEKPLRTSTEVSAEIEQALARKDGRSTIGATTLNCTDISSLSYRRCSEVLSLRVELAKAQSYEKQSALVWDANTHLTHTEEAHGAHDGSNMLVRLLGGTASEWSDRYLLTTVLLLAFMRDWTLFICWRKPKVRIQHPDVASIVEKGSSAIALNSSSKVVALPVVSKRTPPEHIDLLRSVLEEMPSGIVDFSDIEERLAEVCLGNLVLTPKRERITEMLATLKIASAKKGARGARYDNAIGRRDGVQVENVAA